MGLASAEAVDDLPHVTGAWQRSGGKPVIAESVLATARRHLLLMRFLLLNGALFSAVAAAWSLGWLDRMIATDVFHIVKLIGIVFLIGLHQCFVRILQIGQELDALDTGTASRGTRAGDYLASLRVVAPEGRAILAQTLKLKLGTRLGHIRWIANTLVMLGLVGTVVGFIVALTGVDPDAARESSAVGPMVSTLLLGMGMAMYKTLAGIVLNLWLSLNYRLLEHGTVHFYARLVELGEKR